MKPYYEHAGITIYHGDCREVLPTLGPVDLVLTDPPYGEVNRPSNGLRVLDKSDADHATLTDSEIVNLLAPTAKSIYVFCGWGQVSYLQEGFQENGLTTRLGVWEKTNACPMNGEHLWLSSLEMCVFARKSGAYFSEHCSSTVWSGPFEVDSNHPTPKPMWLFQRLIAASCPENGTVLDPFMGRGTTLSAAKLWKRNAIGIDTNEAYCEYAVRRLAQEVLL